MSTLGAVDIKGKVKVLQKSDGDGRYKCKRVTWSTVPMFEAFETKLGDAFL